MSKFFTSAPIAFYDSEINLIPENAIEITEDQWANLLIDQNNGKIIQADSEGKPITIAQNEKTKDQISKNISEKIQIVLDAFAKSWSYDSITTAASYILSTNQQFAIEAKELIKWRDTVWEWAIPQIKNINEDDIDIFLLNMPNPPTKPLT
jgi:hypothetical protein